MSTEPGADLDHIHAGLFGQFERFKDSGVSVVLTQQPRDVEQVSAVRVAADQVASHEQPADRELADLATGQSLSLIRKPVGLGRLVFLVEGGLKALFLEA